MRWQAVRIAPARSATPGTLGVCPATTAVTLERLAPATARRCGQRVRTATAVGQDPANAVHTSGKAHLASEIRRRRTR